MNLEQHLINKCQKLDRERIHIVYLSYHSNFHNFYQAPLLLGTKILGWLKGREATDHICHISRFNYDEAKGIYRPKIFEANTKRGMEENDLIQRLKDFDGKLYIQTLGRVDKKLARDFENDYKGIAYEKDSALFAGVDIPFLDKIFSKGKGRGFCSWLEAKFLLQQGYKIKAENGNPSELTPEDIRNENLAPTNLFYNSNEIY
tara:strand:- start:202 stop:810 length:609 start_codon:yes stop_codon:yes gene_type:complete